MVLEVSTAHRSRNKWVDSGIYRAEKVCALGHGVFVGVFHELPMIAMFLALGVEKSQFQKGNGTFR